MFVSNHTVRNTLGAAVVGGAAMFTAFSAAGQQVANLDSERNAYITAQCSSVTDRTQRTGCIAEAGIRFHEDRVAVNQKTIAAAEKSIASSQALRPCLQFLQQQKAGGVVLDRTITRENACDYARQLGMRDPS